MPEYPGGFYGLGQYVSRMTRGQKEKRFFEGTDLSGRALLGFTVDEHGRVVSIVILESDNQSVTDAALEVAKNMATWKPAKQRGMAVPVKMTLPVSY